MLKGRRRTLAALAATAFVGGLAEAMLLVSVTRTAFAITDGDQKVGMIASWYVSIGISLLVALLLVLLRFAAAAFASWQSARLSSTVVAEVRHALSRSYLDASWAAQQQMRVGSLQELLTTYSGTTSALMIGLSAGVLAAANLLGLIGLAVAVDPTGAVVLVASVALLGLLLRPLRGVVRRRGLASTRAGMEFATSLNEISHLGLELHIFNVQDEAADMVGQLIDQTRYKGARLNFASGIATPIYVSLAYLALLGALGVVAASNTTSLTSLGAVMLVMLRSLSYGQALQSAYTSVAANSPAIEELQRQQGHLDAARRHDGSAQVDHVGRISAESVSFAYVPGQEVLHNISFTITPHEIVGIVGPSGGGKSTLVQLLLGITDPIAGRVTVDGRDIGEFSKSSWARKVTFVPQEPHLIAGTIAENIRFLREVGEEQIEAAARLAHIHDDITAFPEGYQRQVGEQGGALSGGQRQRLCIARALVESPDLLILDEPTSALDVRSEHLIRTTLVGLKERMTVIVIAHRLSTLETCDRIMVIQGGEMKGFDAPDRLAETSDFYREALILSGIR